LSADDVFDPTERLFMLGPRILSVYLTGIVGRSHNPITWEDVAGALAARCSPAALAYANTLVSIESETPVAEKDWLLLLSAMTDRARIKWPRFANAQQFMRMTGMVLREAISPGVCPTCNGRERAVIDDLLVVCQACSGSGKRTTFDEDRAATLGVSPDAWDRYWDRPHADCHDLIARWEREIYYAMSSITNTE